MGMRKFICQNCPAPLEIGGDADWAVLVTDFPGNLFGCYVMLAVGPGIVPCARCSHFNNLAVPHLARGKNGQALILYLPDGERALDDAARSRAMKAVERLQSGAAHSKLVVTLGTREFRRACLGTFVAPAAALLNNFLVADDRITWPEKHQSELDDAFFGALWLLSKGVAPTFTKKASEAPPDSFMPHELAPDAASNVRATRLAEQQIAENTGILVGHLLIMWAGRCAAENSFSGLQAALPRLFPPPAPGEAALEAAASLIASIVDRLERTDGSSLSNSYVLEAMLAILCHAQKMANPRRREWTRSQFLFDVARRRHGKDESLLLNPAMIRETIDESQFWRDYGQLGNALGLGELTAEKRPQIEQLWETAARIYPEQMSQRFGIEFRPAKEQGDDEVRASSAELLRVALDALPETMRLKILLQGLRRNRRQLLPSFVADLRIQLANRSILKAAAKLEVLRLVIEQLNLANYHGIAIEVARELGTLLEGSAADEISSTKRGHLLNEIGNCLRYGRQFEDALSFYDKALELVGTDTSNSDTRVGMQNRAIVLRELHRYSEASLAFRELQTFAHEEELRGLITSEAVCLVEMGHDSEALALLEKHLSLVQGRATDEPHVLPFTSLLAALMLQQRRLSDAVPMVTALDDAGRTSGYVFAQTVAARINLAVGLRDGDVEKAEAAMAQLQEILQKLAGGLQIPSLLQGVVEDLNCALMERGRGEEAEGIIRQLLTDLSPEESPKAWFLYMLAALHALHRQDNKQALTDVVGAIAHLDQALWSVTSTDDVLALLSPQAVVLTDLVRLAIRFVEERPEELGSIGRLAADMRSAPVLTTRARRRARLSYPTSDIEGEERRLASLLVQTKSAVVQLVDVGDDVAVLRTRSARLAGVTTEVSRLGLPVQAVAKVARRIDFALRSADPASNDLRTEAVRGWEELVERLRASLGDLPAGLPLYVAAGPLGEAAFSLALPDNQPVCFIPSLSALIALRARRDTLAAGQGWRPSRMFDFAVWFDRERAAEANALAQVIVTGAKMAEAHGLDYDSASGTAATQERLLAGLGAADVVRLACHGRVLPHAEAVDLLVAAQGYLPPANLTELREQDRTQHVLGWQRLAGLQQAPVAVFSSACDSGLTVSTREGSAWAWNVRYSLLDRLFTSPRCGLCRPF
jgi:tetratricopeptide (TPR) repeat protein